MVDWKTLGLVGGVLAILTAATAAGQILKRHPDTGLNAGALRIFNLRVRAWWLMCSLLATAFLINNAVTVFLFWAISFWALREFITLTPTRLGDHRALFWVFILFCPLQYVFVGLAQYDVYSIFIPVYAFLFILARVAMSGDFKRFLERTAKIQAGLLICVYCLSYAPALLYLNPESYNAGTVTYQPTDGDYPRELILAGGVWPNWADRGQVRIGNALYLVERRVSDNVLTLDAASSPLSVQAGSPYTITQHMYRGTNARLLFFLVLIVQLGDALQYLWGKLLGTRPIAPTISPNKTWEGFLGGVASTTLIGTALYWATPFRPWEAAVMSLIISLMGFAGGMTMSAIKRDRGVKDYGTLVEGHGGVLDRIDSICFAAPVFFHLTKFWLHLVT